MFKNESKIKEICLSILRGKKKVVKHRVEMGNNRLVCTLDVFKMPEVQSTWA